MNKQLLDQLSPLLFIGIILLLAAGGLYYVWSIFTPSPPDLSAEDAQAIAKYKAWLRDNDLPFVGGKLKPEQLPVVYRKVIEHDIKAGDLKSGRSFIGQAIQKQLDGKVLELAQLPEAKKLIGHMQDAHRKVEALKQIVAAVQKGQGEADLGKLAEDFCEIPFNQSACPEQAEEIARIYKTSLLPLKEKNEAVKKVVAGIEQSCLPNPK
jgi:hypothetical protein